jgi:hypothetical protein
MTNRGINTTIIFKVSVAVAISFSLLILIESRGHPSRYFSTRCLGYRQKDFSRKLNDRIVDYSAAARARGISPCKSDRELRQSLSDGKLVRVRSGRKYIIDRMTFSYPAITPGSKVLLDEISRRFRDKVAQKGLYGSRFYVTSMTRMPESLRSLRRYNSNSSANSPHLYGNAFDISYKRFSVGKMFLTSCDIKFLKEALAEVIWQLRAEHKCWATYERMQNCFHVVSR